MTLRSIFCISLSFLVLAGCAATTTTPRGTTPEALMKEGDDLYAIKHYDDAIIRWKKVKEGVTAPDIVALADLNIANSLFENKKYIEAAAEYENFRKLHPNHEKIPLAVYRLGLCYFNQITGIDTEQTPVKNAASMFETYLKQYPSSEFVKEAREKLEACKTKQLQYEIYVGRFYFRTDKYQAAIKRLEGALVVFPKSKIHDETLFYLGRAYLETGNKTKGKEVLSRLLSEFPSSSFAPKTRKILNQG
jgi:outer membrane protein assembly factor BamD